MVFSQDNADKEKIHCFSHWTLYKKLLFIFLALYECLLRMDEKANEMTAVTGYGFHTDCIVLTNFLFVRCLVRRSLEFDTTIFSFS